MYTLTIDDKCQHWDLILAAVSTLCAYIFHDFNSLDTYPSCTMHEQDSVVAITRYVLLLTIYTSHNVIRICVHCSCATHKYFTKFLE